MKKLLCILLSLIMVSGIFAVMPTAASAAKKAKVSLKKTSATLKITDKKFGSTTVKVKKSKGVTLKKTTFKSSNKKVAKVSQKGKVTAVKKGKATVTVKVKYKYKKRTYTKSLSFRVTVKDSRKPVHIPTVTPATSPATEQVETTVPSDPHATESTEPSTEIPQATTVEPATETTEQDVTYLPVTQPQVTQATAEEPSNYGPTVPETTAPETTVPETTAPVSPKTFSEKLSDFSNRLYTMSAKDEKDDYAMSPLSVYMALAMLHSVGDEGVKNDVETFVGMSAEELSRTGELCKSLSMDYENTKLNLSNSIWLDSKDVVKEEIADDLKSSMDCDLFLAPFFDDNAKANADIREYIKKNTNGLIDQDFGLSEDTISAIINTLYFKDLWDRSGEELGTTNLYFNTPDAKLTRKFLLGDYVSGRVAKEKDCSCFYAVTAFGYKVKFILPDEGLTPQEVMTAENLNKINSRSDFNVFDEDGTEHMTRCIFPKFKIESDTPLTRIFKENRLLQNAFTAYFSPLTDKQLCVTDIKHKTVLDVNEKGVEGAAVTMIVNEATAMPEPPREYHSFTLDRPFGFLITTYDNTVLFEGQVMSPELYQ